MKRNHIIANQLLTLFRDCGIVIVPGISGIRNANNAIVSDFLGQFSQIVFGVLIITWLSPSGMQILWIGLIVGSRLK